MSPVVLITHATTETSIREALALAVSGSMRTGPASGAPGRIIHFVTGDPLAFAHTAAVIGEVQGDVVPLPVTELIRLQRAAHE